MFYIYIHICFYTSCIHIYTRRDQGQKTCDGCLFAGSVRHQRLGLGRYACKTGPMGMAGHWLRIHCRDGGVLAHRCVQVGPFSRSQIFKSAWPRATICALGTKPASLGDNSYKYVSTGKRLYMLLPRQTEPSVIKEYDAQVEVIETLARGLQNSTRSLMPLTDATLTQDGITGWSGCDVIRVSLYIHTKHTRNWNRHQNAKRICWEAGDGDIAPGPSFASRRPTRHHRGSLPGFKKLRSNGLQLACEVRPTNTTRPSREAPATPTCQPSGNLGPSPPSASIWHICFVLVFSCT